MFLCFVDEPGSPTSRDPKEVYVLAGVVVPASSSRVLEESVDRLKTEYGFERAEVHTAVLYDNYPVQDQIPGFHLLGWSDRIRALGQEWEKAPRTAEQCKRWEKRLPYRHLTRVERIRFLTQLGALLCDFPNSRIIVRAWSLERLPGKGADGPWACCFVDIMNAFQSFLERAASPVTGLIVHDHIDSKKARVLDEFMRVSDRFARQGSRHWLGPSLRFVDSQVTTGIQLADLCAVAVRKYLQKGDPTLFNAIEAGLEDVSHQAVGGDCACRICAEYED